MDRRGSACQAQLPRYIIDVEKRIACLIRCFCIQLRAFKPFFVSLGLPYSVIRGEQLALQVVVFNYLETALNVCLFPFLAFRSFLIYTPFRFELRSKRSRAYREYLMTWNPRLMQPLILHSRCRIRSWFLRTIRSPFTLLSFQRK